MSDGATSVAEYSAEAKELGDKIANMTLKQAKELSDYLKDVHGIEPASGGGTVMMAAAPSEAAAAVEQTEFDVVLTGFGDKKLNVVKVVKNMAEDGRIAIRAIRRDARKVMEALERDSEISADDLERAEKELEKITHDHVDRIDAAVGRKEEELLEV